MGVKMEVFTAEPACPGCVALLLLADEIAREYPQVEVIKHTGMCDEYNEYGLTVVPAAVFNEGIVKIMGVCPSKDTMVGALKELGV